MSHETKVLLVDDDARNIRIFEEILEDEYSLESAADGESALAKVASFGPDIVLLDVMMPGIDGLEVCRRIRQHDDFRYIKIILVSGKARLEERLEGYAAGADDYVTKPFDHMELLAKVNVYAKLKTIEEVDRLKTDFLSLITHETGTPLNAIIGFSTLLLSDASLGDQQRGMVREILDAGNYLHDKVDRILLLSALKKEEHYPTTEVDTSDLVAAALQAVAGEVKEKNIRIDQEQAEGFRFRGNYQLMQKALTFLLENAVKFSPRDGKVTLAQSVSGDGKHCTIQVEDSGSGIGGELSDMLFGEFRVTDINHHANGLGISLALVKLIVEMHGGSVSAGNAAQGGAIMTVTIPAGAGQAAFPS